MGALLAGIELLLMETKREGMQGMVDYLNLYGFFESPASTKYHGNYKGGLADHSLDVYDMLLARNAEFEPNAGGGPGQKALEVTTDTIAIAALLHDVCKIGAYLGSEGGYSWNRAQPKGHAELSIVRIKKHIELTRLEEMMIRFHMGVYGLVEFYGPDRRNLGEYALRGDPSRGKEERYGMSLANAWYHNPIVKLMYFCDELSAMGQKKA